MSIDPDDFERSRAAVAVSCLEWLRCTGPAVDPSPPREPDPAVADLLRDDPPMVRVVHPPAGPTAPTHPLWDRWLDG